MSLRQALDRLAQQEREKLARENGGAPVSASGGIPPATCNHTPAAAGSAGNESRCLRLVAGNDRQWELPWGSFYGAAFTAATDEHGDTLDCLELSFTRFEAVLRGKHLAGLMDRLHAMNLAQARVVDKRFLGLSCNDREPVITSIEVGKRGC